MNKENLIKKIFKSFDPFGPNIFEEKMRQRLILNTRGGFAITGEQYNVLKKTAEKFEEKYHYIGLIKDRKELVEIKRIPFSYKEYSKLYGKFIFWENILFSEETKWGIIISSEGFAIIGGEVDFMNSFKMNYPLYREHMMIFEIDKKYDNKLWKFNIDWVENVMKNFPEKPEYSSEKSRLYWRDSVKQNIQDLIKSKPGTEAWGTFMDRHFAELFLSENPRFKKGIAFWVSHGYLTPEEGIMLKPFNQKLNEFWEIFQPPRNKDWKLKWEEIRTLGQKIEFKV